MKEVIDVHYRHSDDPDHRCGTCNNFLPEPGSLTDGTDGSCFGKPVTVDGLCDFYTDKLGESPVVHGHR